MTTAVRNHSGTSTTSKDPRVVTFSIVDNFENPIPITTQSLGTINELPMMLNPESMSTTMEALVRPIKTIGGYVILMWGHNLDRIQISGYSPAFYMSASDMADAGLTDQDTYAAFITNQFREYSEGFRDYKKLLDIFRHNGVGLALDANNSPMISKKRVGHVKMKYQSKIYLGYFDNFSEEEDENNPYSIRYDCSFVVTKEKTPKVFVEFGEGSG